MSYTALWMTVAVGLQRFLNVNGQICRGCANDANCYVFEDTNSKYVGCHGTFDNTVIRWNNSCSPGFRVMSVAEAFDEGFTLDMCEDVPPDKMFFFDESGTSSFCQSEVDIPNDFDNVWGCSGNITNLFSNGCADEITDGRDPGSFLAVECRNEEGGTLVSQFVCEDEITNILGSNGNFGINTLQFLDAQYGGVICIREPTSEPTTMPTHLPSLNPSAQPSYNPSALPTEQPTRPPTFTKFPTSQPTVVPSTVPTHLPSEVPTYEPTSDPTSSPSAAPTSSPTEKKEKKEAAESPIPNVTMDMFIIVLATFGGLVCLCAVCVAIALKRSKSESRSSKKDSERLQMTANAQPSTVKKGNINTNTSTNHYYENDMAQFSIKNVAKTRK